MHVVVGGPPAGVEEAAEAGGKDLRVGVHVGEEDAHELVAAEGAGEDVDDVGDVAQADGADVEGLGC